MMTAILRAACPWHGRLCCAWRSPRPLDRVLDLIALAGDFSQTRLAPGARRSLSTRPHLGRLALPAKRHRSSTALRAKRHRNNSALLVKDLRSSSVARVARRRSRPRSSLVLPAKDPLSSSAALRAARHRWERHLSNMVRRREGRLKWAHLARMLA
ncbi:hypothetical protein SDRG_06645 [Saprolegnia diclina VS20]|uniref:Uncharacterized protein n=1 Tax=Saprolegnia diclina (strain VS20) TaxID=1156394 RepID=T0RZN9_SAPDV|nr:hypothetical protein SDRG_06645 [Saprolegnia diclina VS20]EQC35897.1 hypothetical protein SDRG_06645 [Saprolegnia diclina VS20]|eukprot:XP_008610659.1 hypothetical protein SDRG_06645 [Saprolegnia diclina VS20]